ncbi:MAG: phosphoglycerate mutase [Dethiosulfovibrio peptidovorans]|nr:MAG: phosphoglycerate mutase [Dethiosulfovibrio peptidovorans]
MNRPTTVVLIRHGECAGNVQGLFRGARDFPLNACGKRQAKEVAEAATHLSIEHLYTSPLLRARETAQVIGDKIGLSPVEAHEITNVSLGSWEGRKKEEIAQESPELWEIWLNTPEKLQAPGIEPLTAVMQRSRKKLDSLVKKHHGETIALVSHRTVLKPLLSSCIGIQEPWFWRLHFDTASISIMICKKGYYSLVALNRVEHLKNHETEWN